MTLHAQQTLSQRQIVKVNWDKMTIADGKTVWRTLTKNHFQRGTKAAVQSAWFEIADPTGFKIHPPFFNQFAPA
jgi:hypothetical protein